MGHAVAIGNVAGQPQQAQTPKAFHVPNRRHAWGFSPVLPASPPTSCRQTSPTSVLNSSTYYHHPFPATFCVLSTACYPAHLLYSSGSCCPALPYLPLPLPAPALTCPCPYLPIPIPAHAHTCPDRTCLQERNSCSIGAARHGLPTGCGGSCHCSLGLATRQPFAAASRTTCHTMDHLGRVTIIHLS